MEQSTEASQNCFLQTGTNRKTVGTEIYLYDEAEPLTYVCSETSMPPKSAGNIRTQRSAGKSIGDSSDRKSRKSSTIVYESSAKQKSSHSAEGSSSRDKDPDFKSAILNKFKEFTRTPNPSNPIVKGRVDGVDLSSEHDESSPSRSENVSEDIEEIFIHSNRFFVSSSESDRVRNADEVFSTGVSDLEEGAPRDLHETSQKIQITNESTAGMLHQPNPTINARRETASITSPNRMGPPVQGKLSLRTLKTSPPCFCLLEEIRKNNLVMQEDVFSSSQTKPFEILSDFPQKAGKAGNYVEDGRKHVNVRQRTREWEMLNGSPNKPREGKFNGLQHPNTSDAVEIFEATGGEEKEDANSKTNPQTRLTKPQAIDVPVASDFKALTANVRYIRSQFQDSWRPFRPPSPHSSQGAIEPKTELTKTNNDQQTQEAKSPSSVPMLQNHSLNFDCTSEKHLNTQLNDYHQAKTSTPNRRNQKYVKLPGLADAFDHHSNFKGLKIKNGTSFESVNAIEEMSIKNNVSNNGGEIKQKKIDTKDAATDIMSLKNARTQTGLDKTMVDCYVQCESHIVDEMTGRNVIKNDHQEIMVCNDNGDGVQLYNELGHPLTDMDGYLLKDSLGRFLVRLDDYGVPISCTNGQMIFMEDSTPWDEVKNLMSIVHQCKKKQLTRRDTVKKRACPSIRQLESAMKNLKNTLDWADKISLDSVRVNAFNGFSDFDPMERSRPSRSNKPSLERWSPNNTSSLIAEMKSIARLRAALLEKVNFIVDNRKKLEKTGKIPKFHKFLPSPQNTLAKTQLSLLLNQDRPHSPTYRAIRTLKSSEPDSISSSDNLTDEFVKRSTNARAELQPTSISRHFGDSFSTKIDSRPKPADLWLKSINAKSVDSLGAPGKEKSAEENETDFWKLMSTGTDDIFPTSSKRTDLYRNKEPSDMKSVSRDVENLIGASSLVKGSSNESQPKESQLLCSLEKKYNLKIEDSWAQEWNEDKSLFDRPSDFPFEQGRRMRQLISSNAQSSHTNQKI